MTLQPDEYVYGELSRWAPEPIGGVFADANYCGRSVNEGLLRFHNARTGPEADELVRAAWGDELPAGAGFFAIDWLGRQFGAIPTVDGPPMVISADIGLGVLEEVAPLPAFIGFMNSDSFEDVLGAGRYREWRAANGNAPQLGFDQCLSYAHPPFLGGADELRNLELSDISVYWTVIGQVYAQTKDLPEGGQITSVTTE